MSLDVYLHGECVARLFRLGDDHYSLAYTPEAVAEANPTRALLSHSLPLRPEPYGPEATRTYIEGLLPQGARRRAIADELGLDPSDGFGLIAELGADCIGAVSFGHGRWEEPGEDEDLSWLSEDELEELLQPRPERLFDDDNPQRMRFALPGERHKLALIRDEDGDGWAWPQPGMPSTHIVKPEAPERPGLVANEHACSLAYRELGFPVAHTSIERIAGQTCLVCKRFDRWGDGPGAERLHQESFAQALGIAPDNSTRRLSTGTPTLAEASGLLRAIGEEGAVETLMRITFCDLLIGCTELRGANLSLLFGGDGPMLAPFYDILSTEVYGEIRPRPLVTGEEIPPAPLLIDIRHTIELCSLEFQPGLMEAIKLMGLLCAALNAVADDASEEGWTKPAVEEAIQIALSRAMGFRHESVYLRPRD
ncbi:MAG TPA: HipA domain-containing protein [Solirubrobacterales bacterium]|nr:HipA domain-containing protein [Solirubrobacterales bacterium]